MSTGKKAFAQLLDSLRAQTPSPTLLLHSCCAPCSSHAIDYLSDVFDITVYFYNPNIYPHDEYFKRLAEQKRFISAFPSSKKVSFIEADYETDRFEAVCQGYENAKEGGERCEKCFALRLAKTAQTAEALGLDFFGTTMSVSPHKNAEKINRIGQRLTEDCGVRFLVADFKKNDGYKRSIALSKEYGLYRQDYCGCIYSLGVKLKG